MLKQRGELRAPLAEPLFGRAHPLTVELYEGVGQRLLGRKRGRLGKCAANRMGRAAGGEKASGQQRRQDTAPLQS
jgi:hypothetical protein